MNFLSELRPRRFHSANKVFSLPGGTEDNDLWVRLHKIDDEIIGECLAMTSVFEITDEDRALIAGGANVALTLLGTQPPVMVRLTDESLGRDTDV